MAINYIQDFPVSPSLLPSRLRALLTPAGMNPAERVTVTARYEARVPNTEYLHMTMAVIPDGESNLPVLDEASHGVVAYSVPVGETKGEIAEFNSSISGYDYIVASWGSSSFFNFNLAEKVWMALGLTARCIGNGSQHIYYDDLSVPEFGIASGEVSGEYYWNADRDISWTMSNAYLRKYLWMRGANGVRVFFYQSQVDDHTDWRALMAGEKHIAVNGSWYTLDIRENKGGLLLQVWATVIAVSPVLCPVPSANGLKWPDINGAMTYERADRLKSNDEVYLDDRFLEKYEQNAYYDSIPVQSSGQWLCSPSYKGQWAFTDCVRVGRNLIRVPIRELYKPKPDSEIVHAHRFAVSAAQRSHLNLQEEHIAAKVLRLQEQLVVLGRHLAALGTLLGIPKTIEEIVGLNPDELKANGWMHYPQFVRLAQVAPLEMTQQAFLARCKNLHEIYQRIPDGYLKEILGKAGCRPTVLKPLGSLKLLQGLHNIVLSLLEKGDSIDGFESDVEPGGWKERNPTMAALFANNDLRIADAHDAAGTCHATLESIGFDTAMVNSGYGPALDFVMDSVIEAFVQINSDLSALFSTRR